MKLAQRSVTLSPIAHHYCCLPYFPCVCSTSHDHWSLITDQKLWPIDTQTYCTIQWDLTPLPKPQPNIYTTQPPPLLNRPENLSFLMHNKGNTSFIQQYPKFSQPINQSWPPKAPNHAKRSTSKIWQLVSCHMHPTHSLNVTQPPEHQPQENPSTSRVQIAFSGKFHHISINKSILYVHPSTCFTSNKRKIRVFLFSENTHSLPTSCFPLHPLHPLLSTEIIS